MQPQPLNQIPSPQVSAPPPSSVYPTSPQMVASLPERQSQTEFLQNLVLKLMPDGRIASTQSSPSPAVQELSTTQPATVDEPTYWAGTPELTDFLNENGVSSVEELLQYTAKQETSAQELNEIFEYAMHPDPEIRQAFWENYQAALEDQGVEVQQPQQQYQRQGFPGTPDAGYYGQPRQTFNSLQEFDNYHRMMGSGMPNITPQALAEFDRMILSTPGQFWGQTVFQAGDI